MKQKATSSAQFPRSNLEGKNFSSSSVEDSDRRELGMAGVIRHSRGTRLLQNLVKIGLASSPSPQQLPSFSLTSETCRQSPWKQQCREMGHVSWDYRGQRQIVPLGLKVPDVAVDAWVAPNAVLAGDVEVQDKASVWYGAVVRGDLNHVKIGPWTSVGDKCVVHAAESSPTGMSAETDIGKFVTIGAGSTLRSCVIEDAVVIGQRCVIMEGSLVEKNAMLASGSVVPPGRRIPAGEVWAGNPARFVREVTNDEILLMPKLAEEILVVARSHSSEFLPYTTTYLEVEKLIQASKLLAA